MDAIGRFDFEAQDIDELGFRKGSALKVVKMVEKEEWWTSELGQERGLVPSNYVQLKFNNWFRGRISRADAERVLATKPEGGFLVRVSESSPDDFSLSVKYSSGIEHFRILRDDAGKYFVWIIKFNSINDLVDYHRVNSLFHTDSVVLIDIFPKYVKALHDFQANFKDELSIKTGDVILLSNHSNDHWWEGSIGTNYGQFPASHVSPYNPVI